jgi:hypothetical protein
MLGKRRPTVPQPETWTKQGYGKSFWDCRAGHREADRFSNRFGVAGALDSD